jgi:DeoR family transcriptional regulator of aga operon
LSAILERLAGDGSVEVADLAQGLGVSDATIRRDLETLQSQRLLARTHGGATANGVTYELPLRYKMPLRREEKRRIALAAASRVSHGMSVGLTGGTTTTEVARALVGHDRLTIVTNALNIASELAVRPSLKLLVTGGVARPESYELVGPLAGASLAEVSVDVAFVGADGASVALGLTTHEEIEAHTNRSLIERARRVVAVLDSTKLGTVAFARICAIDTVDELITDLGADEAVLGTFRDAGVVVTAV